MSDRSHTPAEAARLSAILRSRGKECAAHDLNRAADYLNHAVYPDAAPINERIREISERDIDQLTIGQIREMQGALKALIGFVDSWKNQAPPHSLIAMLHIRKNILKLTQAEMADVCKVSQGTISKWEAGVHRPDLPAMREIRNEALRRGIPWDDAYFFQDHPAAAFEA